MEPRLCAGFFSLMNVRNVPKAKVNLGKLNGSYRESQYSRYSNYLLQSVLYRNIKGFVGICPRPFPLSTRYLHHQGLS